MPTTDLSAQLGAATRDPVLLRAALALHRNRLDEAEPLLKGHLRADPFDVAAIRMLAELAARFGVGEEAGFAPAHALTHAPAYTPAPRARALPAPAAEVTPFLPPRRAAPALPAPLASQGNLALKAEVEDSDWSSF